MQVKDTPQKKRGRFALEWRPRMGVWVGRIRELDGTRSRLYSMCTDNETLAEQRYGRWLETGEPPKQSGREKFKDAAERIVGAMIAAKEKNAKDRRTRLRSFALPLIGDLEVAELEHHHVAGVLDAMVPRGYSSAYVLSMRVDISCILGQLCREGAVAHNCALGVKLPPHASDNDDDRLPVQLTDEEILQFQKERGFKRELDVMVLHARQLAGHRTSCLHAEDWSDWDTVHWKTVKVRRPKTDDGRRKKERAGRRRGRRAYELVIHAIPSVVVAPTQAWWHAQGCPQKGPVFPVRKGPKAGQRKGDNISYAKALRKAAWEAGLRRPLPGYEEAVGDDRKKFCALQVATDDSLPLDFHSLRRAFITACAQAGMSLQDSMDASGHTQETTHHGYRGPRLLAVPAAAIPGEPLPPSTPEENKQGPQQAPFNSSADPMAAMTAMMAAAMKQAMAGLVPPPPPAPDTTAPISSQKPAQTHEVGQTRPVTKLRIVGRKGGT
jgi:integrase